MARNVGQIVERGPNKFLVRVYLGRDLQGKRLYHNKTVVGTRKDARAYLATVRRRERSANRPASLTLGAYLAEWLSGAVATRVAPRTLADYTALLKRHIEPVLGDRPLLQLTTDQIGGIYRGMLDRGLSARTVRYTHSVLHSALEEAVRSGRLPRNPSRGTELPRRTVRKKRVLGSAEVETFLAAARGDRWYPLWELLVTTGVRPGEALALKWEDVENGTLRIHRALVRTGGRWSLEPLKFPRGERTVNLSRTVIETLEHHRTAQRNGRVKARSPQQGDFVFATSRGTPLDWRVVVRRHFKPIARKAGLADVRPYDLRHTCATLLLAAGEDVDAVSKRLGHATPALTLGIYGAARPHPPQRAADRIEALLFHRGPLTKEADDPLADGYVWASDGRPARDQGPWAREKVEFVDEYLFPIVDSANSRKGPVQYVDLFAGPGRSVNLETDDGQPAEVEGSPIRALRAAITGRRIATVETYHFCNSRRLDHWALRERVLRELQRDETGIPHGTVRCHLGDIDKLLDDLGKVADSDAHLLVFADVGCPTDLPFAAVQKLKITYAKVELFLLYAADLGLPPIDTGPPPVIDHAALSAYFGTDAYRSILDDAVTEDRRARMRLALRECYMKQLGSLWKHVRYIKSVQKASRHQTFDLLAVYDHVSIDSVIDAAQKKPDQLELFS